MADGGVTRTVLTNATAMLLHKRLQHLATCDLPWCMFCMQPLALLQKYKVPVVISGHDHALALSYVDDIAFVTSGGERSVPQVGNRSALLKPEWCQPHMQIDNVSNRH